MARERMAQHNLLALDVNCHNVVAQAADEQVILKEERWVEIRIWEWVQIKREEHGMQK